MVGTDSINVRSVAFAISTFVTRQQGMLYRV